MPVVFIEAPPGIKPEAKKQMVRKSRLRLMRPTTLATR